jgi:hypothetical protein
MKGEASMFLGNSSQETAGSGRRSLDLAPIASLRKPAPALELAFAAGRQV